jgi:alpha-glucoside transport system substrate-binding protein
MSMQTRWRLIAVSSVFALVAAACGGDGGGDGGGGTTGPAQDLSGQTIEVAAIWGNDTGEAESFAKVADAFEKQTGATVEYTSTGEDLAAVIGPRIEGNDPPDISIVAQPGLLKDFAARGALIPIEDVAGDEVDANLGSAGRDAGSAEGTLNDAGVEPPATWEELQTVAQTVSDFGVTPYAIDGASGWVLSDWFENIYLRTAGPEMYDQLAKHEIPWTDQSVKDALTLFADIVGNENNLLGGADGTLQAEFPASVTLAFADPPEAAMVYEGDFVGAVVRSETKAQVGTDADFFPFPSIDGSPPEMVVGSGDIAILMKDSEAGKAFIEYLATPEPGEIWAALGGFISPNAGVDPSVYPDETSQRAAAGFANAGDQLRYDLGDLQPAAFGATEGQGYWGILQDFVRNPDVDGTAERLEREAAAAFG